MGIYRVWWIAGPGCNHISSLNNKRPLCWRLSAYRMTWVVSWDVRSIWIKCALEFFFFFLSYSFGAVVMKRSNASWISLHACTLSVWFIGYINCLTFSLIISRSIIVYVCFCPLVELLRICFAILSILHMKVACYCSCCTFGFVFYIFFSSFLSWHVCHSTVLLQHADVNF